MLPEEYINKAEKRKVLLQIIEDTLSFNQYQVVLMFYFNELSIPKLLRHLNFRGNSKISPKFIKGKDENCN